MIFLIRVTIPNAWSRNAVIGVKDVFGESGPAKELLHKYELDAEGIAKRIMEEQKSC